MRNIGAVATLPVGTRTHLRTKVLQLIDLHSNDGFLHSNDGFSHSNDGFLHSNDGCCTRGSCCDESVRVHAVCCLYTRRRLIDLPLIAGTRNRGTLWGWCSTLKDTGSWMGGLTFGTFHMRSSGGRSWGSQVSYSDLSIARHVYQCVTTWWLHWLLYRGCGVSAVRTPENKYTFTMKATICTTLGLNCAYIFPGVVYQPRHVFQNDDSGSKCCVRIHRYDSRTIHLLREEEYADDINRFSGDSESIIMNCFPTVYWLFSTDFDWFSADFRLIWLRAGGGP